MEATRVSVLVDGLSGYGRGVRHGVARFSREHGPWEFHWVQGPHRGIEAWPVDGLVAQASNPQVAAAFEAAPFPVVNVSSYLAPDLPAVLPDNREAGRQAAEHFLDRGFTDFACYAEPGPRFARERYEGYAGALAAEGFEAPFFDHGGPEGIDWTPDVRRRELLAWLDRRPKPLGLFVVADSFGRFLTDTCRAADVAVPEEVAVVGVDNDDLMVDFSNPPLSSVDPDAERIGHEAASLLARLMAGAARPAAPIRIPPKGLVVRASSDVTATDDAEVARAARFIREHAADPITVDDVLEAVSISRRTLERRFRQVLGRSPWQEIRRVRIERVKDLLVHTDWPMPKVAEASAFAGAKRLSVIFSEETGVPPTVFRRRHRS